MHFHLFLGGVFWDRMFGLFGGLKSAILFWKYRSGNDGEAAAMEVRARVLGSYGRNRDQWTCVYERSAIDEISHEHAGTCNRDPTWIYLRSS